MLKNIIDPYGRKELFTERYFSGSHTYWFNALSNSKGSLYIVLSQSTKNEDGYDTVKFRIFLDEMLEFQRILQKSINRILEIDETPETEVLAMKEVF